MAGVPCFGYDCPQKQSLEPPMKPLTPKTDLRMHNAISASEQRQSHGHANSAQGTVREKALPIES